MTTATLDQAVEIQSANDEIAAIKGQKATMLIENSMGCIVLRHITLGEKTQVLPKKSCWSKLPVFNLYYAMKGCRKVQGWTISEENPVVLAQGWQTINGMTETTKGQFSFDSWDSCDHLRFDAAKDQLTDIVYCYGN